ncbi:hypothetical protein PO909_028138 [Leuciscus waleckii]
MENDSNFRTDLDGTANPAASGGRLIPRRFEIVTQQVKGDRAKSRIQDQWRNSHQDQERIRGNYRKEKASLVPLEQNATNEPNLCVFPHVAETASAPPPDYNTNHYPVAEISALKLDLDLDRFPPAPRTAQEARLAEARAQIELAEAAQRAAQAEADARAARGGAEAAERVAQRLTAQFHAQLHGRLSATLRHATHAEEDRKEKKKPFTMVVMQQRQPKQPNKPASSCSNPAGRKGQKGRAAGGKWSCYVCATNAHSLRDCTKCRVCKKDGHWSSACPTMKSD